MSCNKPSPVPKSLYICAPWWLTTRWFHPWRTLSNVGASDFFAGWWWSEVMGDTTNSTWIILDICIGGWIMKNMYRCIVSAFDYVNVIEQHKDLDVVLEFHAVSLPTTYIYIHRYIWELSLTKDSDWTCWTKSSLTFEQLKKKMECIGELQLNYYQRGICSKDHSTDMTVNMWYYI